LLCFCRENVVSIATKWKQHSAEKKNAAKLHLGATVIKGAVNFMHAKSLKKGNLPGSAVKIDMKEAIPVRAPLQVKSILRSSNAKTRRMRRTVRFKGMVSYTYVQLVAICVRYTRSGSLGAAWWEAFIAGCGHLPWKCCEQFIRYSTNHPAHASV
jgi:hypothetical protein